MSKIPRTDPRAKYMAADVVVDRAELDDFVRDKHRWVLATTRKDNRPQMSMVTGGLLPSGQLAIATYPSRVKARNARTNPLVSVAVMGDEFNAEWVQIDGTAEVIEMPEAADAFVEYFRCISGEHSDWDEYRQAMTDQGKCLMVISPTRWSPISKGGFPSSLFED